MRFINRQRGAGTRLLLDFLLKEENLTAEAIQGYDLVVPESTFQDPRFQVLLAVILSKEFQEAATALGGYDLKDCGKVLYEQ